MMRLFRIVTLAVVLTMAKTSPAQGEDLPDSAYITGVSGHAQGYTLSCESRSAADWAAYWGVSISETQFLESLPEADNPDEGFVGYVGDAWGFIPPYSYGVHAGPVAAALQAFGLQAEARNGLTWDDLRAEISAGRPVIVWVIGQMWGGTPVEYEAHDGSTAVVAAYEHTMILTGYSSDAVQVVDAYSGQYQSYWLKTFLKSWGVLGNMAVFGSYQAPADETQPQSQAGTYTVQPGDYLVALAETFGTTWQALAELNAVSYPFTIFVGQVLNLPPLEQASGEEPSTVPAPASASPSPQVADGEFIFHAHIPMLQRYFIEPLPSNVPVP